MPRLGCGTCLKAIVISSLLAGQASGASGEVPFAGERDYGPRPIDYGAGPGVSRAAMEARTAPLAAESVVPSGPASAHVRGVFGAAMSWPIIPIHAALLPDGRILNYGTNELGQQGGQFIYDVWDSSLGAGSGSHLVLPNTTGTDLFCSGQSVLPASGNVLLTGGDTTIEGVRNYSEYATNIFFPRRAPSESDRIAPEQPMTYARWYPTVVPLASGDKLIVGGREAPNVAATTPELFSLASGWRTLPGAASSAAFGNDSAHWWYPRAFQMPDEANKHKVFVLTHRGQMFLLDVTANGGSGSIIQLAKTTAASNKMLPTVMFAPDKLLSLRGNRKAVVVTLNRGNPWTAATSSVSQIRYWANATVLPDGQVLVTGGSASANKLTGVAYANEIWNPVTGRWTLGAEATKSRLYHSIALLLPDGSVLTGGGGAPGPVKNLNAEIYYPPYLYDSSGNPAPRPSLLAAPQALNLELQSQFSATVGTGDQIGRVTLLHTGSVTHAVDVEQRFEQLNFSQSGSTLTISTPKNRNYTIPGYYMLFIFNTAGVPGVAKIIKVS